MYNLYPLCICLICFLYLLVFIGNEADPGSAQAFAVKEIAAAAPQQQQQQQQQQSAPGLELVPLGTPQSTVGRAPCYLAVHPSGDWIFAAGGDPRLPSRVSPLRAFCVAAPLLLRRQFCAS